MPQYAAQSIVRHNSRPVVWSIIIGLIVIFRRPFSSVSGGLRVEPQQRAKTQLVELNLAFRLVGLVNPFSDLIETVNPSLLSNYHLIFFRLLETKEITK